MGGCALPPIWWYSGWYRVALWVCAQVHIASFMDSHTVDLRQGNLWQKLVAKVCVKP